MILKDNFITQDVEDIQFLVPVGGEAFQGIVRSNETAAFIVNCLKKETTEEAIAEALLEEYEAPKDVILADIRKILEILRGINALDE